MERSTVQGITQDKIKKTNLGEFHLYTFQTNKIQVNSCLCLTWPISFRAFIVNSLPNSPVISTPPRLETVRSALLQSPSHVPLAGCWDNVSSKLLTLECLCELCSQEPVCMACWTRALAFLLTKQRKAQSLLRAPKLLIAAPELTRGASGRCVPCPEGLGVLHQLTGTRIVTHGACL